MTGKLYLTKNRLTADTTVRGSRSDYRISFWNFGAGMSLAGGLIFLTGTIFLVVTESLYGEKEHGVWLFPTSFLLLMLGAHCLDKIDDIRKEKVADYKKRQHYAENVEEEICRNQRFR